MRIAIFHNALDNIGGAEIVDLTLARELGADIYTTNIDQGKIQKMGFSIENIYSIGRVPLSAPFRQEAIYWRFRFLNLGNKYDFYIIAGDWAVGAAHNHKPNLWYVYSPSREVWDLRDYVRKNLVPFWKRPAFDLWVHGRRLLARKDAKEAGHLVAISKNVEKRIQKYLGQGAKVVYPPTETGRYFYRRNGDFWLSVNRLVKHKRIEMQLEAFRKLPHERLVIVGSYEGAAHFQAEAARLKSIKPDNVKLVSWVNLPDLGELYADCKGVIATAMDEDYGMTPVEAMAAGKPVIAPAEGGYLETIVDGETGMLIEDITPEKLIDAIKTVGEKPEQYRLVCQERAKKFDTAVFVEKIKEKIYEDISLS